MGAPLLEIRNLSVVFPSDSGPLAAVRDVSFTLERGETLGVVGESGSGKSTLASAIMGIIPDGGKISGGEILFNGENILLWDAKRLRAWRGNRCSIIFQNPMSSFDPLFTIGRQIAEAVRIHTGAERAVCDAKALGALSLARMDEPERRFSQYPHELSGGQLQRAMIAMALVCSPDILIADEPTTSLDATVQAQILDLLGSLCEKLGMAMLFISHDLEVSARMCRNMLVMYGGGICERGSVSDVLLSPAHEYTKALLRCIPPEDGGRLYSIPGSPPYIGNMPRGCAFCPRCENAMHICAAQIPPEAELDGGHRAACWRLFQPT